MTIQIHDQTRCTLGEGPLWHPQRQQLFWFDILGKRLHTVEAGKHRHWQFDMHVSAAGWIDCDHLLIASERGLHKFDLRDGTMTLLTDMEAENDVTRSNDGRADPWGGFWIGTMGFNAEKAAGAIYRYFQGKLTILYRDITISNAICFAPDRSCTYFADTPTRQIMRQKLDEDGWPQGAPEVHIDLRGGQLNPDGAVVDAEGCLWNAQWGAGRVSRYDPEGHLLSHVAFPAAQMTCPAFGGSDLTTLYATSAAQGLTGDDDGKTFLTATTTKGQAEHQVIL